MTAARGATQRDRAPAVSVTLAVRDGARFLPAALESLLGQSFRDFELIAVDDGSRDETPAILEGYAARDKRIVLLRNDKGRGLAASLNRAVAASRAPLLARADGDDLYHSDRLARQIAHLAAHPDIGVLSCGYRRIDADGRLIDIRTPLTGDAIIRFQMLFMNALLHPGAMVRTEMLRRVGGYDEAYWTAQDSDLWARLLQHTRMDNLPEPLVDYRIHTANTTKTRGEAGRNLSLSVPARLLGAYLGRPLSPEGIRAPVDLYGGFVTLTLEEAIAGEVFLQELLRVARGRESGAVLRHFRRRVSAGLIRQGRTASADQAGPLLRAALRWWPGSATARGILSTALQRRRPRPSHAAAAQSGSE
jgi:hypothetical protein